MNRYLYPTFHRPNPMAVFLPGQNVRRISDNVRGKVNHSTWHRFYIFVKFEDHPIEHMMTPEEIYHE